MKFIVEIPALIGDPKDVAMDIEDLLIEDLLIGDLMRLMFLQQLV